MPAEDRWLSLWPVTIDHSISVKPGPLDAVFLQLYRSAVQDPALDLLWEPLVKGLATALRMPQVLISHYDAQGTVSVLAGSTDNELWLDLQRLPERWDDSVVGRGLAAMALKSHEPALLDLSDERFVCWHDAARRDRLGAGWAAGIETHQGRYLLQIFAERRDRLESPEASVQLREARELVTQLLEDVQQLQQRRLLASALEQSGNAAFITDREGTICWANRAFGDLYDYAPDEVVGQNPRFLKSGRQGVRYYRDLWQTIRSGRVWAGETVDRDRNGTAYTVRQTISPFGTDGRLTHYLAIHDDVSDQAATRHHAELLSGTDPLTGLMTRAAFEALLSEDDEQPAHRWSLLVVSLRELQLGADALGPDVAGRVASEIGHRIREVLNHHESAGVLAPGEYGIQVRRNGHDPTSEIQAALERALSRPLPQLDTHIAPHPRFAVAHHPEDGMDYHTLLHRTDRQLSGSTH